MRNIIITTLLSALSLAAVGCGDDEPSKGRLGATCEEPADCESGLCTNQICVNPAGGACTENRHCVTGVCLEGGTCGGGSVIGPESGGDPACSSDSEACPSGQVCDLERGVCVPEAPN